MRERKINCKTITCFHLSEIWSCRATKYPKIQRNKGRSKEGCNYPLMYEAQQERRRCWVLQTAKTNAAIVIRKSKRLNMGWDENVGPQQTHGNLHPPVGTVFYRLAANVYQKWSGIEEETGNSFLSDAELEEWSSHRCRKDMQSSVNLTGLETKFLSLWERDSKSMSYRA